MAETVQIGDREYTVERFSIFKAELVGDALSAIFDRFPALDDALATFRAKYREQNALVFNRATAEFRHPEITQKISDEAWAASDNELRVPMNPNPYEELAGLFPQVFEIAKTEVLQLLAIVATANQDLADADEADRVDAQVAETAKRLRHSDMAEVLALGGVAVEVLKDQLGETVGKLPNLRTILMPLLGYAQADPNRSDSDVPLETEEGDGNADPSTSAAPNGSGSSEALTAGPDGKPSTVSRS